MSEPPFPPYLAPPPPPPPPSAPRVPFGSRPRVLERPLPRFGTAIATVGAVLVLIGLLIWAGGYLIAGLHFGFDDDTGRTNVSGNGRRLLGVALGAVVVVAGYAVLVRLRRGPLATAGAVTSAFAVPIVLLFLTFDFGAGIPLNIDAIYMVSIVVWLASYFFVPGAQGRAFYLGLAALTFASYIGLKAGGDATLVQIGASAAGGDLSGAGAGDSTDAVTAVGLLFGLGYYALAALLDRRGRHGAAVGLVVAAFFTVTSGAVSAVSSFGQVGAGVLLLVLGAGLAFYGGWAGRRFTTWVWALGFAVGLGLIVQKALPDSYTGAGIVLIVVGVVVVAAAQVFASVTHEPPDIDDTPVPAAGPAGLA